MSPRPARFTREDAVSAAFALASTHGAEHVTMRRVAGELGVDPMALYRHFSARDELMAAIADRFWERLELPEESVSASWQDYAHAVMTGVRAQLGRDPGVIPIVATHPIGSAAALAAADGAVGALLRTGAPVHAALGDLVNVLVMLTVASALGEFAPRAGSSPPGTAEELEAPSEDADGEVALAALPHLGALMAAGWRSSHERQFDAAIRAVLAGWRWQP